MILIGGVAAADDWPQFYGPGRDNRSEETGLLEQWPEGGPELAWTVSGLGVGYAIVAVADGMIYTTGDVEGEMVIFAMDPAGNELWRRANGPAYEKSYPGSRCTPTIDGGKLFCTNGHGNMICLDAKTGEEQWSVNFFERFGGREITWGVAESPLVVGDIVICCPGGEDVFMAALDRDTGETRWTCTGVGDNHSHTSPMLIRFADTSVIVQMTGASLIGVDADTGKLLFKHPHPARVNVDTPIYDDGSLYIFGTWGHGATRVDLAIEDGAWSTTEAWHEVALDNEHGGVMLIDGHLYGQADNNHKTRHMVCMNAETGETVWTIDDLAGKLSSALTYVEGLLYIVTDQGEVGLIRPITEGLDVISRFQIPPGGTGPLYAFPVVSNGRLFIRHGEYLFAYDVGA